MLTKGVAVNRHDAWIGEFRKNADKEYEKVIKHDLYPEKEGMTMGEVIRLFNEKMPKGSVLVTDVGQHQMIANRYFNFSGPRSCVTSGGLGTMGFGLPAALGAKLGAPQKSYNFV